MENTVTISLKEYQEMSAKIDAIIKGESFMIWYGIHSGSFFKVYSTIDLVKELAETNSSLKDDIVVYKAKCVKAKNFWQHILNYFND